jgi:hypothetical protein
MLVLNRHAKTRVAPVRYASSRFRNYTHSEPRFRALLTEGGAERLELVRA